MIVAELIERLKEYPAEATIENDDGDVLVDESLDMHIVCHFKDNSIERFPYVKLIFDI